MSNLPSNPHAPTPSLPFAIDSTMLSTYEACPRKFFFEYVLHRRAPSTSVDLHAGRSFASAIEHWRKGASPASAIAHLRSVWGPPDLYADETKALPVVALALSHYMSAFSDDHVVGLPEPAVEVHFEVPLPEMPHHPSGQPFTLCGTADSILLHMGSMWLVDEKTTKGSFSRVWGAQWLRRTQFSAYVWGLSRSHGLDLSGVLVRGIALSRTRREPSRPLGFEERHLQLESGDWASVSLREQYAPRPPHLLQEFARSLSSTLEAMLRDFEAGWWRPSGGSACTAYGRPCEFLDACLTPQPTDTVLRQFPLNRWDPKTRSSTADSPTSPSDH